MQVKRKLVETMWYMTYKVEDHTCMTWADEIALSSCSYGCKVYRCSKCGAKSTVHNATYGCR